MAKSLTALTGLCAALLLTAGCTATGTRSASGTQVTPAALDSAQALAEQRAIPTELRDAFIALHSQGRQNSVLHAMRLGLSALRLGRDDLAREAWDQAIREVEALQEGAAQAERSKSRFVAEREKWFKGESFERAALYVYRGLLYLREQDFGNAAACFRRAQIQDITGDDEPNFAGDWFSAEWGLALASLLQNQTADADAARQRAERFSTRASPQTWPALPLQTLLVVEVGTGPIKYRAGKFDEQLKYQEQPTPIAQIRAGQLSTARNEDFYLQATTRGTRQVDHILAGKASFKEDTGNAAIGLFGAAAVASEIDDSGIAPGVLALAGLGNLIASAASNAEADIRQWNNLPQSIYFLALPDPPPATVEALDGSGQVVNQIALPSVSQESGQNRFRVLFLRIP